MGLGSDREPASPCGSVREKRKSIDWQFDYLENNIDSDIIDLVKHLGKINLDT